MLQLCFRILDLGAYFDMLSSLVKEHQAKQASRKEKQGVCSLIFNHRSEIHTAFACFLFGKMCAF
jgi:hypothetical protein